MKAYLIDAAAKSVTEVDYDGDYRSIYTLIGCTTFTVVNIHDTGNGTGDSVFMDDEGLLKPQAHFFKIVGFDQPFAGNGLVLGTNEEGESVEPTQPLDRVVGMITFHSAEELGFDPTSAPMDQTDDFDPVFISWEEFTS